ncbi:hypothetical protein [Paractinoplanes lichenicola]|uniref:Lipoprotein n=1 Tax=Paractinoplanes lichenicola TaxID=2802976 RepID=A0ABS1VSV7_9ACTN|nr:hypothetical protein [Actinoplanes lichenicola]MBL7257543.1 hypothetical protein [Actinoplanes lichenicola]
MRLLVAMAVGLVLAGCAAPSTVVQGLDEPSRPSAPENLQRLRERARVVLANYDKAMGDAGFVVVGRTETGSVGALETSNEHLKQVISAGLFRASGEMPAAPRQTGEVVWGSGARLALPLISAREGLRLMAADNRCSECTPHPVTGARLGTMRVMTTRGEATVPAWEYTLAQTKMRILRAAVDSGTPVQVDPPAGNPDDIPHGAAAEAARPDGLRLTVKFTGSREGADKPCGADYTAEAVESERAVAVLIQERPYDGPPPSVPAGSTHACMLVGYMRTVTVTLSEPLGGRAVIEVQQGQPVPVKR